MHNSVSPLFVYLYNIEKINSKIYPHYDQTDLSNVYKLGLKENPGYIKLFSENKAFIYQADINQDLRELCMAMKKVKLQSSGNTTLLNFITNKFENDRKSKKKAREMLASLRIQSHSTMVSFKQSLQTLENIKLHSALQLKGATRLKDVYYSQEKMDKWQTVCQQALDALSAKIMTLCDEFQTVKKEISGQNSLNQAINALFVHFERELQQQKKLMMDVFVSNEASEQAVSSNEVALSQKKQNLLDVVFLCFERYSCENIAFSDHIAPIQENYLREEMMDIIAIIKAKLYIILKEQTKILQNTQIFASLAMTRLDDITQCMKNLMENEFIQIEKNFSYLQRPALFPSAYHALFKEIQRRKTAGKALKNKLASIIAAIKNENERRQTFLREYGNILPDNLQNLIPCLKQPLHYHLDIDFSGIEQLPILDFSEESSFFPVPAQTEDLLSKQARVLFNFMGREMLANFHNRSNHEAELKELRLRTEIAELKLCENRNNAFISSEQQTKKEFYSFNKISNVNDSINALRDQQRAFLNLCETSCTLINKQIANVRAKINKGLSIFKLINEKNSMMFAELESQRLNCKKKHIHMGGSYIPDSLRLFLPYAPRIFIVIEEIEEKFKTPRAMLSFQGLRPKIRHTLLHNAFAIIARISSVNKNAHCLMAHQEVRITELITQDVEAVIAFDCENGNVINVAQYI